MTVKIAKEISLFFEKLLVYEVKRNEAAFDMRDEKQVDALKELIPDSFTVYFWMVA